MRRITLILAILVRISLTANNALAGDTCSYSDAQDEAVAEQNHQPAGMPVHHPVELIDGLNIELVTIDETHCAYMEGTVLGDMDALFGEMMAAAGKQMLFTRDMMLGSMSRMICRRVSTKPLAFSSAFQLPRTQSFQRRCWPARFPPGGSCRWNTVVTMLSSEIPTP